MRKLIFIILLLPFVAFGQTNYQLNYDSIRVGKTAGTGATSLYGKTYLKNATEGTPSDSVLTVRNGRVYKIAGSAISSVGFMSYIFSRDASDITGYEQMPALTSYVVGAADTATVTATIAETLIQEFATNSGFPNTTLIPAGKFTVHYETQKAAGSNNYYSYAKIYKRALNGTETLLATTDNSSTVSVNTLQQVTVSALLLADETLLTTDRIVTKVYVRMSASTASINLYYDNGTDARLEFPSALVDATNFVPYNGATKDLISTFSITGDSIKRVGGTGAQFLMGDGTVQDTTTIQTVGNFFPKGDTRYVKKSGDTMTGTLNGTDIVLSGDLIADSLKSSANGMLYGFNDAIKGSSKMTFLNDSTIAYDGFKYIQNPITGQNPGGNQYSTFVGYRAGEEFLNGSQGYANTGIGRGALLNLKSNIASEASSNTAVGHNSGRFLSNTTGATLIGTGAGDALTTNATSESVSGFGWHVFNQSPSAYRASGFGTSALYQINSVLPSAVFGYRGAVNSTTADYLAGLGSYVFENNITGDRKSALGGLAAQNSKGSRTVHIGTQSDSGTGNDVILIGDFTRPSTWNASSEGNIGNVILFKGVTQDSSQNTSAQLGIGVNRSSGIAASAILDLTSTDKGFLTPRMTGAQRTAITPATGLLLYETNVNKFKYYNGTSWKTIADSALTVGSVSGTANQITVTGTTSPVLSLPSSLITPGSVGVNGAAIGLTGLNMPNQNYIAWYASGTSGAQSVAIRGNGSNLEISSDGGLAATFGASQAVTFSGNVSAANLTSGTYTPTLTNSTNVGSSALRGTGHYTRIGNEVTAYVSVSINPISAASITSLGVSLPIASNLVTQPDLIGVVSDVDQSEARYITLQADGTNDRADLTFTAQTTSTIIFSFSFRYTIM